MTYCSMKDGDTCSADAMLSKPSRGVVRRQQLAAVDVDRQQVADRVRVLLAIQPVQHDLIRRCAPASAAASSESSSHATSESTAAPSGLLGAGRRHDAPAQLAHGLLEHLGMLADVSPRSCLSKLTPPAFARSL